MQEINYSLIILFALIAIASPGPATLAIAAASIKQGRLAGMSLALGVLTGSLIWSVLAAFGLAMIMEKHPWLFDTLRFVGAAYLLFLAFKSARSAMTSGTMSFADNADISKSRNYIKGLLIHLTNPKAILFFASLYSIGVPPATSAAGMISVILTVGMVSTAVFLGYGLLFAHYRARSVYIKSRQWFEAGFALVFGTASLKILVASHTE